MAIYDLWLSRNNPGATIENYVGHTGRLFYDSATGELRISDGVTPGGLPIAITIATASQAGAIKPGAGFLVASNGTLSLNAGPSFYLDETNMFRLRAGTETQIGGVKSGNGIIIASDGTINLDTEGLSFVFGDFFASTPEVDGSNVAALSSVNENQDIALYSNGTGAVNVIGEFNIFATDGDIAGAMALEPFFRILSDGQVRILVPLADTTEGGLEIVGSELGTSLAPGQPGAMLHLTGNADLPTRVYHDTLGDYSSYVFRRYNGSVVTPTAVLANEDIGRFNFTAATSSGMGGTATAQISVTALENQTVTAQGSKITFTVTPVGSAASARVNVATITAADGVSATKFTGPLTGDVTGNVTGDVTGNVSGTAGSVAAANITGTTLASGVVTSSLTSLGSLTGLTVNSTNTAAANIVTISGVASPPFGNIQTWKFWTQGSNIGGRASRIEFPDGSYQYTAYTGNADTVTNGVYTTGDQTISGAKTFSTQVVAPRLVETAVRTVNGGTALTIDFASDSIILWTAPSGTANITLSNYTAGATVKVIIALTTSRDINFGVNANANSSTGADAWNGSGAGAVDISNTAVHLTYTCVGSTAATTYVQVVAN